MSPRRPQGDSVLQAGVARGQQRWGPEAEAGVALSRHPLQAGVRPGPSLLGGVPGRAGGARACLLGHAEGAAGVGTGEKKSVDTRSPSLCG